MTKAPNMRPTLDQLDRDGALREAADRVPGHTRAAFMRRAGAFVGGTLLASGLPASFAMAQGSAGATDKAILDAALGPAHFATAYLTEVQAAGRQQYLERRIAILREAVLSVRR